MNVHLYCLCWNEAKIIPHFLRHYVELIDEFYVFDNGSTDASIELLRSEPRVHIEHFDAVGDSFILQEQQLSDTFIERSRGRADWVVIVDMDEFLFHPNFRAYLSRCSAEAVTAVDAVGFEMVSDTFPDTDQPLHKLITKGVRSRQLDKPCLFDPQAIDRTNFTAGRHSARPDGRVKRAARRELALLHYKFLGLEYLTSRLAALATGLRPQDRAMGWGEHWTLAVDNIERMFVHHNRFAVPVPGLEGGHDYARLAEEETRIQRSHLVDVEWYLSEYPDVAAANIDPITHYEVFGHYEGRQPRNPAEDVEVINALRRSELVDEDWYLAEYPDVASAKLDPIIHYYRHGHREGRQPRKPSLDYDPIEALRQSGLVDTEWYLAEYPDVAAANIDPVAHFFRYGHREGRQPRKPRYHRIDSFVRQSERVFGWTRGPEATRLAQASFDLPDNAVIVEIGSFFGSSSILLAGPRQLRGSGRVVCVDPFDASGDSFSIPHYRKAMEEAAVTNLHEYFINNMRDAGLLDLVEVRQGKAEIIASSWSEPIDMLLLDGDQSIDGARKAYEAWAPFLKPGGVIAVHNSNPGPRAPDHDGYLVLVDTAIKPPEFVGARLIGSTTFAIKARPSIVANNGETQTNGGEYE